MLAVSTSFLMVMHFLLKWGAEMRVIRLHPQINQLSFDQDVGRLIAIATFPDETMLRERMEHDWRIGRDLLAAVRTGRLTVRDSATLMPMDQHAPWYLLQTSVVMLEDFRAFVATLGYTIEQASVDDDCNDRGATVGLGDWRSSKLSDQDRIEIVRLFANGRGVSVSQLSKRFDVSRPTIDRVLERADAKVSRKRRR